MMIYNVEIHSLENTGTFMGYIAWENGRIAAMGGMDACPAVTEEDVDGQGLALYPGFVDAHCHLGLLADGLTYDQDDCNEVTDPITPNLRAIDALYPQDNCFREARESGITTVLTGPGSANVIGGQFAAIKTAGRWIDEMIVKAPAAMKFALGENPKGAYGEKKETPMTRMATAALIREQLAKAKEYAAKLDAAAEDEDKDAPDFDAKLETLVPVVKGELPAHFHAHRADDIATAIRIAKEFSLDYVILHGTEGHLVADLIAKEGVSVVPGPIIGDRSKPELANQRVENAAKLAKAGIKVALCTDHPENPIQYLPLAAGVACRAGLDAETALKAITIHAAEISGIADRVGSLKVGKDADFVLWEGNPLSLEGRIHGVWIDGKRVK